MNGFLPSGILRALRDHHPTAIPGGKEGAGAMARAFPAEGAESSRLSLGVGIGTERQTALEAGVLGD